jgi:hypothetical protein
MPSKKRVHLQQSGIISLAKSRFNLHQESWEKQDDLPNCWDNHKLCKWVGKSYKKLYCTKIITKACLLRCKITYTQITVIIDTSEQGMWPYLHDEICKITHKVKNLLKGKYLLFMAIEWHSKLASPSCKIYWEKHYLAFLKVVEDS